MYSSLPLAVQHLVSSWVARQTPKVKAFLAVVSDITALVALRFVVQIYLEHEGDMELVAKSIESSDLDFSRYGVTFFEVVFIGGRT